LGRNPPMLMKCADGALPRTVTAACSAAVMAMSSDAAAPYRTFFSEFQTVQSQPPPGNRSTLTLSRRPPCSWKVAAKTRSSTAIHLSIMRRRIRIDRVDGSLLRKSHIREKYGIVAQTWPIRLTDHPTFRRMPTGTDRTVPMDDVVQEAIKTAIEALPEGEWALLEPSERTRRIYDEVRRIDAGRSGKSARSE